MSFVVVFLSVIIIFLLWLCYRLLRNLYFLSEGLHNISLEMGLFVSHLESIYSMDMYHGDETLDSLLLHSRDFRDSLNSFVEQHAVDLEIPEEGHEEEETDEKET